MQFNIIQVRDIVLHSLDDDLAYEVVLIDVTDTMQIASYMVIASGTSKRHVSSIAHNLLNKLKKHGIKKASAVGFDPGHWIAIDIGTIIIHIFIPEIRLLYNLEGLWNSRGCVTRNI